MRILIIEDEHYAALRLKKMILKELPDAKIVEVLDSVSESTEWLSSHIEPNLIFMDIQLADGLSFQIFDTVKVSCPIIFTTAYDEYALKAFKVNSIDYLLKPLEESALRDAINKYQQFFPKRDSEQIDWNNVMSDIFKPKAHYKQRFLIKIGSSYTHLNTQDIGIIFSEDGLSFAFTMEGKKFILDNALDHLEKQLDPDKFFRISRKHIISTQCILKVHPYLNNRLKVESNLTMEEELIVSREKKNAFKNWLDS